MFKNPDSRHAVSLGWQHLCMQIVVVVVFGCLGGAVLHLQAGYGWVVNVYMHISYYSIIGSRVQLMDDHEEGSGWEEVCVNTKLKILDGSNGVRKNFNSKFQGYF